MTSEITDMVNFITCPCCGEVIRLTLESQKEHNKKKNQETYEKNSTITDARNRRVPCPECGSKTRHRRNCSHNPMRNKK